MNTIYCSCGSKNMYAAAKPRFCASCGEPFDKVAASLVKVVVPQEPISTSAAPYGYCPACGAPGVARERRMNGTTTCENGHEYLSSKAKNTPGNSHAATSDFIGQADELKGLKFELGGSAEPKMTLGSIREAGAGISFARNENAEMSDLRKEAQKVLMQEVAARNIAAPIPAKRGRPRKN